MMSKQPRLFTAKRETAASAPPMQHRSHHHEPHHARVQKMPGQAKEIVEDIYGDLS